jgi:hypothetical protein
MNKLAIPLTFLALTGCASQTPQDIEAALARSSDFQVCEATMYGRAIVPGMAYMEASRRNLDCRPYANAVAAKRQQQNQAAQNMTNAFIQRALAPPPPPPPPQRLNCRSYWVGNQVQTDCN